MSLKDIKFTNDPITTDTQADQFFQGLELHGITRVSMANTLRTVFRARQRQNVLMDVARRMLRAETNG